MIEGISHITLIVQDLERTGRLLRDVLGATEVYRSGATKFSVAHERFYLLGQVWIAIVEGSRSAERSYDHIAFAIPDSQLEEYRQRLEQAGVELLEGRSRVEGEGSSLYFYDYDNHLFELHTGSLEERLRAYQGSVQAGQPMAERHPKLVCFDLDGTVMLRPNSLQYLLRLNTAPEQVLADIDRREASGGLDWIVADFERAPLIAGLPVAAVENCLDDQLETIANLDLVLNTLRDHGILTVVITSGPVEVAQAVARRFAFDHCFGSDFEICEGDDPVYTGRITRHLGATGKVDRLLELCRSVRITLNDCAAVGDGESDIALFQAVGTAIGINCSSHMARFIQHQVRGQDLSAILPFII